MSEEKKPLLSNKKLVARPAASKLKAATTVLPKNEVQAKAEELSKKLVSKKAEDAEDDFDEADEIEEVDEELEEETKPVTKKASKKKSKKETSKEVKKSSTKEVKTNEGNKEPEYNGPRIVRVFGRDIYTENDPSLSFEQIRQKLEKEYSFPNFKENKVFYDFDSSTGVLEVLLKFNSKG